MTPSPASPSPTARTLRSSATLPSGSPASRSGTSSSSRATTTRSSRRAPGSPRRKEATLVFQRSAFCGPSSRQRQRMTGQRCPAAPHWIDGLPRAGRLPQEAESAALRGVPPPHASKSARAYLASRGAPCLVLQDEARRPLPAASPPPARAAAFAAGARGGGGRPGPAPSPPAACDNPAATLPRAAAPRAGGCGSVRGRQGGFLLRHPLAPLPRGAPPARNPTPAQAKAAPASPCCWASGTHSPAAPPPPACIPQHEGVFQFDAKTVGGPYSFAATNILGMGRQQAREATARVLQRPWGPTGGAAHVVRRGGPRSAEERRSARFALPLRTARLPAGQ